MTVEPLEDAVYQAIKSKEISETKVKKKDELLFKKLVSLGVPNEEAKQYKEIYGDCALLDKTRGEVHIGEVIEMVMAAFEQIVDQGVLAREPSIKLKVSLIDTKLHEDAIHRGPAQVIPAVRDAMKQAILDARPVLYEPIQEVQIEGPIKFINEITRIVQSRRGQMMGVEQEEDHLTMHALLPVAEMFGLSNDLRSSSEGRATFYIVEQSFSRMPSELQDKIIRQIRNRKGLAEGQ